MLKISHAFDAGAIEPIAFDRADDIRVDIRADSHRAVHNPVHGRDVGSDVSQFRETPTKLKSEDFSRARRD